MCGKICCRIQKLEEEVEDDITSILIFGVSGVTGGAVMEACTSCAWFRTGGFTRATEGDFYDMLKGKDIRLFSGDMTNYHHVAKALGEVDVVFLTTHFWETLSVEQEYIQGFNVVNASMEAGVRHLIYAGTDYSQLVSGEKCRYLEGKARVEAHIVNSGIPYTILHLGFFYENLLGLFKPHRTSVRDFAVAFPMGDVPLNMGSVLDFGQCVARIALRPSKYIYGTVKLAAESLRVCDVVAKFNQHFGDNFNFYDPRITLNEYSQLEFPGSEELHSMWAHYSTVPPYSHAPMVELNPKFYDLDKFLQDRRKVMGEILAACSDPGLGISQGPRQRDSLWSQWSKVTKETAAMQDDRQQDDKGGQASKGQTSRGSMSVCSTDV